MPGISEAAGVRDAADRLEVLDLLGRAWDCVPHLTLGQLLDRVTFPSRLDTWHADESQWCAVLDGFVNSCAASGGSIPDRRAGMSPAGQRRRYGEAGVMSSGQ